MARRVTSPAGEEIDIIPDEEWIKRTGCTEAGIRQWTGTKGGKAVIIAELWLHGKFEDQQSGRATHLLHEAIIKRFPEQGEHFARRTSTSTLMLEPINAPAIKRTTKAKRTYFIQLVALPDSWYRKLRIFLHDHDHLDDPPKVEEPIVEPIHDAILDDQKIVPPIDQVEEVTVVEDFAPPLELSMASQVAMSLLTTVVEIISAGSPETVDARVRKLESDSADIASKLAARLSENETLRKQLRTAGDDIIALRTERDGLRQRIKATEANLTAALNGEAAQAINGEIMRRVDSIMRVAPSSKKGAD